LHGRHARQQEKDEHGLELSIETPCKCLFLQPQYGLKLGRVCGSHWTSDMKRWIDAVSQHLGAFGNVDSRYVEFQ
jgi:hypothetical protein